MTADSHHNWAGNVAFHAAEVAAPRDVDEIGSLIVRAVDGGRRVNTVGTGHSFSDIADTDGLLVSTTALTSIGPLDERAGTVWVDAGVRFAELGSWLAARGRAVHNLPSLPHISIVGAVATATHGSGDRNGNLSSAVTAVDLVGADGSRKVITRDDPSFAGVVVSLGALGVVARVELAVRPAFDIAQRVWLGADFDAVVSSLDDVLGAAYSVSLFTRWTGPTVEQVWVKSLTDASPVTLGTLGATPAPGAVHPIDGDAAACSEQLGIAGPSAERLPHFRIGFVPSVGAELQSEYFVARDDALAAIGALRSIGDHLVDVLLISEIRSVAADDLWLSPATGGDVVGLHFTWRLDPPAVLAALAIVESALAPFAPRPHWGKLTTLDPTSIRACYPAFASFDALRRDLDPAGTFLNAGMQRLLD